MTKEYKTPVVVTQEDADISLPVTGSGALALMPEPGRTEGGQRRYGALELDRLAFIRHSRQLGFSLESI